MSESRHGQAYQWDPIRRVTVFRWSVWKGTERVGITWAPTKAAALAKAKGKGDRVSPARSMLEEQGLA